MNQEDAVKLAYQNINQLKAYIYTLNRDWDSVDDIMQETLMSIMKSAENYRQGSEFLPWALTIARRRTYDFYKKHKDSKVVFLEDICESLEVEYLLQESEQAQEQQIRYLQKCLKKLSPDNQLILRMKYFEKMKVDDVSKKLGRSFLAVQSILDRLRTKLKKCINYHIQKA
jgi:RNA polymerase sigma-70 factor (ECF subfamily)